MNAQERERGRERECLLTKHPRTPMITVKYENMVIWTTIHNLSTSPCKSSLISKDNRKEVNNDIFRGIILLKQNTHQMRKKEYNFINLKLT